MLQRSAQNGTNTGRHFLRRFQRARLISVSENSDACSEAGRRLLHCVGGERNF